MSERVECSKLDIGNMLQQLTHTFHWIVLGIVIVAFGSGIQHFNNTYPAQVITISITIVAWKNETLRSYTHENLN